MSEVTISTSTAVEEFVEQTISSHKIAIFAKSHCPYSKRTKDLFAAELPDETPAILDIDEREDCAAIQDYLLQKTGQRTVPNVFVNQTQIGGNDKTHAAFESGELAKMIQQEV
ncbi:glutaredoxin [Roridomyces roridus]|uniref:Glutaredoxin n=1 Tax=Roridomyces roridus TaxID=1738132 RepID=A0AAD7BDD0_9AGAR|nr:glutaredoxin [Roridomyces roridus]